MTMERSECPSFADLSAHLDGELGAKQRVVVEGHLRECSHCRNEVSRLRALSNTLGTSHASIAPIDIVEQVRERVANQSRDVARRHSLLGLVPLALTASILLGIGINLGSRLANPLPMADLSTAARMAPFVAVPPGNVCLNYPTCYLR